MTKRSFGVLGILACLSLAGCLANVIGGHPEPTVSGKEGSITLSNLSRIIDSFADREVVLVAGACDAIERDCCKDAAERSMAHHLKTMNATAVYDIVSDPNPLSHLADLYILVNLQYLVWVKEGQALRFFGEKGMAHASRALEEARREVSRIADMAMKPESRASLDQKIVEWRRSNPDVRFVSMIRLGSLPDPSGRSPLEVLGSLFDVLNPLDESSQKVADAQAMTERVFHFTKRLPPLLLWQTQTAIDEMLATPEVGGLLASVNETSGSLDRVSRAVESVPETVARERKEILAAWDAREAQLNSTAKEVRATLSEAKELAGNATQTARAGAELASQANDLAMSVRELVKEIEKLGEPSKAAAPSEPAKRFDISEYAVAAGEFTKLAREISVALRESQALLDSPAWIKRQEDVNRLTQQAVGQAGERGKDWVDHVMLRGIEGMVAFFILLLFYRAVSLRVLPRRGKDA
jgi:hypothetical protein